MVLLPPGAALQDVITFWQNRSWDDQYGGFLTNFDENRNALETPEKYLNTQAHLVRWFSTLHRHYPINQVYKRLADDGAQWMIAHFWDQQHGSWFWKVRRDGRTLLESVNRFGELGFE